MENIQERHKYKNSKFNHFIYRDNCFLVFNTLYSKLYRVNRELWYFLKVIDDGYGDLTTTLIKRLFETGLIVENNTDEEKLMYHIILSSIYENRLSVTIIPTEACNFRCVYCFEPHHNNYMTDETEKRIIKFFRKNTMNFKSIHIDWFGGEPLLQKERIVRIMKSVKQICQQYGVPLYSTMVTNGYLLDVDTFDQLINTGVYYFQITLDGSRSIHDKRRKYITGGPTYEMIYNNILNIKKQAKQKYFHIIIRSNITKSDYEDYQQFLDEILTDVGDDKRFQFSCEPIYDWGGTSVKQVDESLFESRLQLSNLLLPVVKDRQMTLFDFVTGSLSENRCIAGKANGFLINYDGQVYKCGMISEEGSDGREYYNHIGAINKDGKLDINEANNSRFLELAQKHKKCDGCCWLPQCLICTCPLYNAKGHGIRCLKEFIGIDYLNESIWSAYSQGKAIDLTNLVFKSRREITK